MGKQKPSEGKVDTHSIFCPTCGKPGDKVQDDLNNLDDTIVVIRCPKCDTAKRKDQLHLLSVAKI